MKLKVLSEFRDKYDRKTMYKAGQIIEISDHKRAANLVARDLCDFVEEQSGQELNPAKDKGRQDDGRRSKASKRASVKEPEETAAGDAPADESGDIEDGGQEPERE